MLKLLRKSWVFAFLIIFLSLAANFSFEPNEIFISQEFLTASLTHNLEDDLPPVEPDKVLPAEQNTKHSLSLEDQLDDIAEKLDIIQQQVEELIAQSKPADEQKIDEQPEEIKEDKEEKAEEQSKLPEELPQKVYVSSGAKPNYLKIGRGPRAARATARWPLNFYRQ